MRVAASEAPTAASPEARPRRADLGLVAVAGLLLIARETTQAQGRYLFVAVAAIAVLLTVGTAELTDVRPRLQRWCLWLWPALLALAGLYAALRFLLPFAGL